MEIIHSPAQMTAWANKARKNGKTVGLTPTMGAFHEGHLSLMRMVNKRADLSVTSIFVNPTQFGVGEDLDQYPSNIDQDTAMAEKEGVDVLFVPTVNGMYPEGFNTTVIVQGLTNTLCGRSRPGHFDGVTTVVAKLFNIIKPDLAIFGRKDFQQLAVINKMVRDLNWDIDIIDHPIVREPDGLAMSSRNTYLTATERQSALALSHSINYARQKVREGEKNAPQLINEIKLILRNQPHVVIDYVNIVHQLTLNDQTEINSESVLLVAARVGTTRLIDNTILFDEN